MDRTHICEIYRDINSMVQNMQCSSYTFLRLLEALRGSRTISKSDEQLVSLTAFSNPSMRDIYALLVYRDELLNTLRRYSIKPELFMLSLLAYIFNIGKFDREDLYEVYRRYIDCEMDYVDLFYFYLDYILQKLAVFYG